MQPLINPYSSADFSSQIFSVSHEHCRNIPNTTITAARIFNYLYRCGIRHFALSNYWPSIPVYPLATPQDTSVSLVGDGTLEFSEIPSDAIGSPNAEQHDMNVPNLHINGIGSTFSAGSPHGQTPVGMDGANWRDCLRGIFANLQYSDAGGATINHPKWSNFYGGTVNYKLLLDMLDFDDRVLGIEIFNKTSQDNANHLGWDIETWDTILKTGRRCWGFCVPDHDGENYSIADTTTPPNRQITGLNVLLCEPTEYDCLKAYREGRFYGKLYNTTNLAFSNISFEGGTLSIETVGATKISIIIDGRAFDYVGVNNISADIPDGTTYVRVQAEGDYPPNRRESDTNDMIFSNPLIFTRPARTSSDDIILFS